MRQGPIIIVYKDILGFNGGNGNLNVDPNNACFKVQQDNVILLLAAARRLHLLTHILLLFVTAVKCVK